MKDNKIEIKVDGKEWKDCLDKAFKKSIKKVKIDGFRPGKAPKNVFLKKYGIESLYPEASDNAIEIAYDKLLKEHKDLAEQMVAKPEVSLKDVNENEIIFEFEITVRPQVKLGKYKGLDVKKDEVKVSKKEVNEYIDSIMKKYAEDVIKEGAIAEGDIADIDFEGFVDGVAFEGGKGNNYSLKIGSGTFIPGFEDQLIGLKAGEDKDVVVTFPEDYQAENLKGKEATFKVHINEVKEVKLPEFDKEFFEDLAMEGVTNKEELEKKVKENIKERKEKQAENKYLDDLLEAAAKNVEVEIPKAMTREEVDRMIREYSDNLKMQGITLEQFYKFTNSDEDSLREQAKDEAIKRITYRLMLEEIAEKEKIEISEEEAKEEVKKLAEKYSVSEEEFLMNFGGLDLIKYDLKMRKAMDILKK